MIIGIGIDAVDIKRMEKSLAIKGFKEKTFTAKEVLNCHGNLNEYYATRFAAKEAVFKAIGKPKDWRLIETLNDENGKPYITYRQEFEGLNIHISITTETNLAIAYCVAEKKEENNL